MEFRLISPAFVDGGHIPMKFTCDGEGHSPPLTWGGAPEGIRSYALIMHDPDAPRGDFTHWLLFNIPDDVTEIPESTEPDRIGEPATNDFENLGYGGPCPPSGNSAHRYIFTLYALDTDALALAPSSRRAEVEAALKGHILGEASLQGVYKRK
jgi:Raf kinase inhibitor-like YbhB/YbcL family protein